MGPRRRRPPGSGRTAFLAARAEALCVNCSSRTKCRSESSLLRAPRLPLADRQAARRRWPNSARHTQYVAAIATDRAAAARRGRRGTVQPVADSAQPGAGHPAPREADALCGATCRAPASLRPPPAPRKKKRTRAPARDWPARGARWASRFGRVDSGPVAVRLPCLRQKRPWSRAACGERRPSRAKKAPPATPSAVLVRGGGPARTPGRVARSPAPRTPALASPAPPQTPAVTRAGRPAGGDARGAADAGGPPPPETPETKQPPSVTQS